MPKSPGAQHERGVRQHRSGPLADALRGIETACETAADGAVLLERAASAKALWCETEQACRHYLGLNGDLADRGDVGAP
jgi:hypothetical protein